MTHIATLQDREEAGDLCEVLLGCDFTKFHCVTCSSSRCSLLPPTCPSNYNDRSLNEGGDRMKLSTAGVWDISLVENSNTIQLFFIVNCLGGWPAFIVALWEHSFDQRIHILPSASPFLAKSYILPPSGHTPVPFDPPPSDTVCTHKSSSLLKHLDCILLWHINLHIWNIYFKKKNVTKITKKIKQWDVEVVDLTVIGLFLLRHLVQSLFV